MTRYLVLLRGINVGGRNKLPMTALRELLEAHGHTKVSTSKSMTIRSWQTTLALLERMEASEAEA